MTNKLEQIGLKESKFDPCLSVGEKVTCIVYFDNLVFWARNKDNIHNLKMHLRELGVDLDQEDGATGLFWSKKAKQDLLI